MLTTLHVEPRTPGTASQAALIREHKIPAVVYGKTQEATPLALDRRAFARVFEQAGETTIITLEGLGDAVEALIKDVAFHPVTGAVEHVDFYAFERGKELTVTVPLVFVGVAPAEKKGGTLTKVRHEVEVTCRPRALPQSIEVDVCALTDFDTHITVADLSVPEGVTVGNNPGDIVALVQPVEEEREHETEAVDMAAVEVEKKGKERDVSEAS